MAEIRDRVREQIAKGAACGGAETTWSAMSFRAKTYWLSVADQILSIKIDDRYRLAVIDEKAELPPLTMGAENEATDKYLQENREIIEMVASMMGTMMLKANYVKEVE